MSIVEAPDVPTDVKPSAASLAGVLGDVTFAELVGVIVRRVETVVASEAEATAEATAYEMQEQIDALEGRECELECALLEADEALEAAGKALLEAVEAPTAAAA